MQFTSRLSRESRLRLLKTSDMYFDDFELGKLEFENDRDLQYSSDEEKPPTFTHRRRHSCMNCKELKKISGDVKMRTSFSPSALLCYSVVSRDVNLLKRLVSTYPLAVNDLTENGVSALHLAALDGDIDMIKVLISSDADINLLESSGRSVLDYAVSSGQFDASQYLIECGADLSKVRDGVVF